MTNSDQFNPSSELNLFPPPPPTNSTLREHVIPGAPGAHREAISRQSEPRTPAQIIAALDDYRQTIKSGFDERRIEQRINPTNLSSVLMSALGMAQAYLQRYLQSTLSASASASAPASSALSAPSASQSLTKSLLPLFQFAASRPLLVGISVGAAIIIGPARLAGWCGKAITLYRLASLVKSG